MTDEDARALLPLGTERGQCGVGRGSNQLLQGGVLIGADLWLLATGMRTGREIATRAVLLDLEEMYDLDTRCAGQDAGNNPLAQVERVRVHTGSMP